MTIKGIELPRIHLREMSWRESLYMVSAIMFYVTWNLVIIAVFILLRPLIASEWIAVILSLMLVGSLGAVIYILAIVIPDHIWRRQK